MIDDAGVLMLMRCFALPHRHTRRPANAVRGRPVGGAGVGCWASPGCALTAARRPVCSSNGWSGSSLLLRGGDTGGDAGIGKSAPPRLGSLFGLTGDGGRWSGAFATSVANGRRAAASAAAEKSKRGGGGGRHSRIDITVSPLSDGSRVTETESDFAASATLMVFAAA